MRYRYVFLLGRPGCGKSALYRELKARLLDRGQVKTAERLDDFGKLWARFKEDDAREKEGKGRLCSEWIGHGRYRITSDSVLDEILNEVNSDALRMARPDHLVFLEFARNNNVEALQNFDKAALDQCLAIYLDASFDVCWQRNVARYEATTAADGDDHRVPRQEMEPLYRHDDRDALIQYLKERGVPFVVVNNEADGEEHLRKQVEGLVNQLFYGCEP